MRTNAIRVAFFGGVLLYAVLVYMQIRYQDEPVEDSIDSIGCSPYAPDRNDFFEIDGRTYPPYVPLHLNKSINFDCLNSLKRAKKILIWTPFWTPGTYDYPLGLREPFIDSDCPVYNCEIFSDRRRLREADYVYANLNMEMAPLPSLKRRPKHQRWIMAAYESPMLSADFSSYNGYFNYSSTYSLKSHFPGFYETEANFMWEKSGDFDAERDFSANKTKFAAVLVSNCDDNSQRLNLIWQLRVFIQVSGFGRCMEFGRCDRHCRMQLAREHKFFLAFENAVCDEYATEKFFSTLQYDIIPVVYGGAEYAKFVPKSAFIDVLDFKSIKALADYLKYLDSNSTAYDEYFKWKKYLKKHKSPVQPTPFCDMCIRLNLESFEGIERSVLDDLGELHQRSHCRSASIHLGDQGLFKIIVSPPT